MKRLAILVVFAVVAFVAYRGHETRQAPIKVFTAYADAVARGRHDLARQFADGDLAGENAGERHSVAGWVPVQELRGTSYSITSRTPSGDGRELALAAVQTVAFNPPGVESALRAAMKATFNLRATLRQTPSGWKVVAFTSEFVDSGDAR